MEKFDRKYINRGTDDDPVWQLLPDECVNTGPEPDIDTIGSGYKAIYSQLYIKKNNGDFGNDATQTLTWLDGQLAAWRTLYNATLIAHFGGSPSTFEGFWKQGVAIAMIHGPAIHGMHIDPFILSMTNDFGGGANLIL
jgi:hypothetical protein